MPRSSRSPGDPGAPLEDVALNPRPRRIAQRGRNTSRMVEDTSSNMNDNFLLPVRINAQALGLTQCMLGCVSWFTCFACSLRTQAQQVLFNTCRCKLLCQKLMEKTGILLLCAFGFWMFSIHLPSKMKVWQDNSINGPLQSLRLYQEKVRHHSGEIQDLRGSMNLLIAKLQEMEAMSDEQKVAQKIMKMIHGDYIEKPDFALKSTGASIDFEHTSATYNHEKAHSYWNWIQLWNYAQPPDVILEPNVTPGNCWAFEGNRGQVTIQLAQKVYLSNLTLQHIPKTISPSGSLDTAPKDFVIYGMEGSPKEEVFLGAFQFQPENIIQMFPLQNQPARAFGTVKVKISSNWGNPAFTCLYRVRVHGSVAPPAEQASPEPLT
ncbi:PREDICTED: SUN domain-containing protein 5 [Colobus angolensis palliatus]|uniref:SUN domain-containing protein 5 n=1 Tax=Colobus angolensis palliatus TaxID=336983 RepID=UPI0005F3E6D6|nr:PREDICTED: SUN domain-containing protein 5 [Colobus angolensis palliatus]